MYSQENILQAAKQKSALIPYSWAVSVLLGTLRTTESPADPGECPREAGGGFGGGRGGGQVGRGGRGQLFRLQIPSSAESC